MFSKDCMHSSGKADRCLSGSVGMLSVAMVAPAVNMLSKLWAWLRCEMAPPSFVLPSAVYRIHTSYSLLHTPFLFCRCWSFPSPPFTPSAALYPAALELCIFIPSSFSSSHKCYCITSRSAYSLSAGERTHYLQHCCGEQHPLACWRIPQCCFCADHARSWTV